MSTVLSSRAMSETKRTTAIVLTGLLAIAGLTAIPSSASASIASSPTIVFDGNTLATSVPPNESSTRSGDSLRLSTDSLSRTATTSRSGYSFGGWSLTLGGAATNEITTTASTDTTRTIFAVWNTTLNYSTNGATSGTIEGAKSSDVYRFGQTLTLPTAGTLTRTGFAFGGWMPATVSTIRSTVYSAASLDSGNPTLYAAWIKTVTFNSNSATTGTAPAPQVFLAGGDRLRLPSFSEMTLRKPGYVFSGWATTASGTPVSNPASFEPLIAQQTMYAIWKVQSTKGTSRVFFNPGKSTLRASQKLVVRDLVDTFRGGSSISITLTATRPRSAASALGRARNAAVVKYLESLNVVASYKRVSVIGKGLSVSAKKNNRVTVEVGWTNPTN
jgi:uncharacterized repeat protein (TIGR02543 family)